MTVPNYSSGQLKSALSAGRRVAVVGFSASPARPSHEVAAALQALGYRIRPVNPGLAGQQFLGERVAASLDELAGEIDIVDVFRRAEECLPVAEAAIRAGAKVLWLQQDIVNHEARKIAEAAGLTVIMDRCTKVEARRLLR